MDSHDQGSCESKTIRDLLTYIDPWSLCILTNLDRVNPWWSGICVCWRLTYIDPWSICIFTNLDRVNPWWSGICVCRRLTYIDPWSLWMHTSLDRYGFKRSLIVSIHNDQWSVGWVRYARIQYDRHIRCWLNQHDSDQGVRWDQETSTHGCIPCIVTSSFLLFSPLFSN